MDGHLIIEFATKEQADFCVTVINQLAAAYWQAQGYTVVDGQLVGKNAATGEDMPDAAKTSTWDIPKQSPDGTWYITSPAVDTHFAAWRDRLPEGVVFPVDKQLPTEWTVQE